MTVAAPVDVAGDDPEAPLLYPPPDPGYTLIAADLAQPSDLERDGAEHHGPRGGICGRFRESRRRTRTAACLLAAVAALGAVLGTRKLHFRERGATPTEPPIAPPSDPPSGAPSAVPSEVPSAVPSASPARFRWDVVGEAGAEISGGEGDDRGGGGARRSER